MVKTDRGWTAGKNISLVKLNLNYLGKVICTSRAQPLQCCCIIAVKLSAKRVLSIVGKLTPRTHGRRIEGNKTRKHHTLSFSLINNHLFKLLPNRVFLVPAPGQDFNATSLFYFYSQ